MDKSFYMYMSVQSWGRNVIACLAGGIPVRFLPVV